MSNEYALREAISTANPLYEEFWQGALMILENAMSSICPQSVLTDSLKVYEDTAIFGGLTLQLFYRLKDEQIWPAMWKFICKLFFINPFSVLKEQKYQLNCAKSSSAFSLPSLHSLTGFAKKHSEGRANLRHSAVVRTVSPSFMPNRGIGIVIPKTSNCGAVIITGIIYEGNIAPYVGATTLESLRTHSVNGRTATVQCLTPAETRSPGMVSVSNNSCKILERSSIDGRDIVLHIPSFDHWFGTGKIFDPKNINQIFQLLSDEQEAGVVVSFECSGGKSRSFTFIVAYLMFKYRLSLLEAVMLVIKFRPDALDADPNNLKLSDISKKNPAQGIYLTSNYLYWLATCDVHLERFCSFPQETQAEYLHFFALILAPVSIIKDIDPNCYQIAQGYYAKFCERYAVYCSSRQNQNH
jgi:hypothetical protein